MPAKKTKRVKLTLHSDRAKLFSSVGIVANGTVLDLPAAEADAYIERGCAVLTDADVSVDDGDDQEE